MKNLRKLNENSQVEAQKIKQQNLINKIYL